MASDKKRFIIKLFLGSLVIYYVLHSKMVNFHSLDSILFKPKYLLVSVLVLGMSSLLCTFRWYLLVRTQGLSHPFRKLFELTMIGNFFNTFMPGSLGGDLIKAWYIAGHHPENKTKAIFTVLIDRTLGLGVIICYAGFTLLFYTDWLSDHPSFLTLAYSVWLLSATGIVMGLLFFVSRLWKPFPLPFAWILDWGPMKKIIDAALLYRRHAKIILYSIALSTLSVFVSILLYQFLGDALGINLTLTHYLFLVPIVMIVSAIPLLPGGIGLGQVAFFTLFQWMGSLEPDKGGALCSVFQVYVLLFNCLGAIFYFKYKHEGQIAPRKQEFKEEVPQRHAGALLQRPV